MGGEELRAQRLWTRRDALKFGGGLTLAAILAACARGGTAPASGGASIDWNSPPAGKFTFANWPLYIDKKKGASGQEVHPSLQRFTKETGIQVDYLEIINDYATFFGQLQPVLGAGQPSGYDLMVMGGDPFTRMIDLGYLQALPSDHRPNWVAQAAPLVRGQVYDPKDRYSMAWQSGFTGIVWDPKQVASLRPNAPDITSFRDLFDPAFAGKVGMLGNTIDLPNMGLLGVGAEPATSTPTDWQAAADLLIKQRDSGVVRQYYGGEYVAAISSGDLALAMGWSGDALQLSLGGDASGVRFTSPDEGGRVWTDVMCMPVRAAHPVDAITFADFVYQPEVAAMIAAWVGYVCPVPAAKDVLLKQAEGASPADAAYLKEIANSPLVFPGEADLTNLYPLRVFANDDERTAWNDLFEPVYQT